MIREEEIISKKIADRCCRRGILQSDNIEEIVAECSIDLGMAIPRVIYCETLTRSLSAFYFRKIPYMIYDSCLLEALYIYDGISLSGNNELELYKLVYKLIGEELIRNNQLERCLYFSKKYQSIKYLFDKEGNNDRITELISLQSYFLIGHELGHLQVRKQNVYAADLPGDYRKFIKVCIKILTQSVVEEDRVMEFLEKHFRYFMQDCPRTMEQYFEELMQSKQYENFVEECYCDWNGVKLLLEHYGNPKESLRAISLVFKYLIIQEAIRSDIEGGKLFFDDPDHEVSRAAYFSVLRLEIVLLEIRFNNLGDIEEAFFEEQEQHLLTDTWMKILRKIPNDKAFKTVPKDILSGVGRKELANVLINTFYYMHVQ